MWGEGVACVVKVILYPKTSVKTTSQCHFYRDFINSISFFCLLTKVLQIIFCQSYYQYKQLKLQLATANHVCNIEKFFLDFKMLHFISALEYATIGVSK